jgi:hypothetical protein
VDPVIEPRAIVLDPAVDLARLRAAAADLQLSVEAGRDALDDATGVIALLVGPEAVLTTVEDAARKWPA